MQALKIYGKHIRIHILSGLEYKGWWMMLLSTLTTVVTDPISTVLLFARFGTVGPWSMERILMIYALAVASFGLAETFCRGFDYFPWRMIRSGDFDRLLLRPCSLFVQVAASFFHIHRIARPVTGVAVVIWAIGRQGIAITPMTVLILAQALAGGCVLYSGVFVLSSGIAFFTIRALDWIYIVTNASYQVTRCPVDYMPRLMRSVFTFCLPILLISYYPCAVVCGWGEPLWTGFLALPAGLAFMGVSQLVWRFGVRHYKSTGS